MSAFSDILLVAVLELVDEEVGVPQPEAVADVLPPFHEVGDKAQQVVEITGVTGPEELVVEFVYVAEPALRVRASRAREVTMMSHIDK